MNKVDPPPTRVAGARSHFSFERRSSFASSIATALIGWCGLFLMATLLLGEPWSALPVFAPAALLATLQVIALRLASRWLGLAHSTARGAVAGAVTAWLLATPCAFALAFFAGHPVFWWVASGLAGAPVGAFLSYFERDDAAIEAEALRLGRSVEYGRDAHWLEPFVFGALVYVVVFRPHGFEPLLAVSVLGALVGVVAAALSHYSPHGAFSSSVRIATASALGVVPGAVTAWLSRSVELGFEPLIPGCIAGVLTFLVTLLRGRTLARLEAMRSTSEAGEVA